jgi:2-polyprenyl-3-methyl-5-hydroxy-6-metoxy-1,4-benzoquinol methylase
LHPNLELDNQPAVCWCGNTDLADFSDDYLICHACGGTLVARVHPAEAISTVVDDAHDFYGKRYWFEHAEDELGQSDITARSRSDLRDRVIHWLRTLLKYRLPPARVLELGSSHGGFVAVMSWAGYEATGLELSPSIVTLARELFGVTMLLGPVEQQSIDANSLDVIALMDVLEHLPDPVKTIEHCLKLLKPDGILLVQTPNVSVDADYDTWVKSQNPFLKLLIPIEHIFLFSHASVREFLRRLGVEHITFEPGIFAHYDMFFVASRQPLATHSTEEIEASLQKLPTGKFIQALIDLDTQQKALQHEKAELAAIYDDLRQQLDASEADREARLQVIQEQGAQLRDLDQERTHLRQQLDASEADREARLQLIQEQGAQLDQLHQQFEHQRQVLSGIKGTRTYRLLRSLGRWDWVEKAASLNFGAAAYQGLAKVETQVQPIYAPEYEIAYTQLRAPKQKGGVNYAPGSEERLSQRLQTLGIMVHDYIIDVAAYRDYFDRARYTQNYPDYYSFNLPEKSLEHFLAARFLELAAGDVYIDIASEHSPVPEIYERLYGVQAYRQDLAYEPGLHEKQIGGDAARMPLSENFASKMALHCSFEHFEGDSDIGFVQEAARVLKPGGKVCIVPLHSSEIYAVQTDPIVAVAERVAFEPDATLFAAPNWNNRHGRFYDPEHLYERVFQHLNGMSMEVWCILNATDVDPSCYVRFAMLMAKL